ncbi:PTS sugar transporter subunit IIC [Tetragenococcus halophilus]|uniref:PTS sugar transporter subunit IIC n=1 Tax=Tetragenococcus halophilus TaxID=51669 RepID=UPI0030C8F444
MDLLIGIGLLLLVLAFFTVFTFKAPYGRKTMSAFADASVATLLVEAFLNAFVGNVFNIEFFSELGTAAGSMEGAVTALMVIMAIGGTPVNAVLIGASIYGFGILPGLVVGYVMSYLVKFIENKFPEGVDLLVMILIAAPLSRLLATYSDPVVTALLSNIGRAITASAEGAPAIMGFVVGGIMAVVSSSPISSMALAAMLQLKGLPMAATTMAVWSTSFMNFVIYSRLNLGGRTEAMSVFVEPKTQVDLTSANPLPVYLTNLIGGGLSGSFVALMGMNNLASSTATPFAGLAVMFAYNPVRTVILAAFVTVIIGVIVAFIISIIGEKSDLSITTKEDLYTEDSRVNNKEAVQET